MLLCQVLAAQVLSNEPLQLPGRVPQLLVLTNLVDLSELVLEHLMPLLLEYSWNIPYSLLEGTLWINVIVRVLRNLRSKPRCLVPKVVFLPVEVLVFDLDVAPLNLPLKFIPLAVSTHLGLIQRYLVPSSAVKVPAGHTSLPLLILADNLVNLLLILLEHF